jgi:SAM-dependent methyltransferase
MSAPPNFNRLARIYRWMELASFGPWLWWCRCTYLDSLTECRRALVIGDGDGRFTARLLHTNPAIQTDAVDASTAMLASLLRRAGSDTYRVRTFCADARQWQPANPPYDLIVTHFFLDCLTRDEIQSLAATLHKVAFPQALWLVSEFAIPAGWFGRLVARPLVWCLYPPRIARPPWGPAPIRFRAPKAPHPARRPTGQRALVGERCFKASPN